jgi:uncharacterized membrane protein
MVSDPLISDPLTVTTTLVGIVTLFFYLEQKTKWRLFTYFPPLLFVYTVPMILSTTGVLASQSSVYDWMRGTLLPFLLTIMLLKVDVLSAIKVMGRGVLVMLSGTLGVILGAPLAYLLVKSHLNPDAWKAFGALSGSWIGGTGNMASMELALNASGDNMGLAVLADNAVYVVWLPILLGAKNLAPWFHRFVRVDPERIKMLEDATFLQEETQSKPSMPQILYLLFIGFAVTFAARQISGRLPQFPADQPVLTTGTWNILIVTTLGLLLSRSPARKLPCSHELAMALVFLFVANMGARANLSGLATQAPWFLMGAFFWIAFHGLFCLLAAWVLRVDIHSTVIASAANIGGAASAPVVAAHHNPKLVPVSILMALMGYAVGTYGALMAAWLCRWVAGV